MVIGNKIYNFYCILKILLYIWINNMIEEIHKDLLNGEYGIGVLINDN